MADEWIDYDGTEDADDWGFAIDEDFGGASALDNILVSSDIPKSSGGTLIPGLAIPELSSINFDGSIPRERVSISPGSVTVGKYVYLDENNNFYTSTEPTDTDISYQVIDNEVVSTTSYLKVLKDGAILELSASVTSSIWIVQEAWDDRDNGSSGWVISSEGNSIFNNVAVRGQIEATSGFIGDSEASGWQISSNYIYNSTTKNVFSDYDPSFEGYWKSYWTPSSGFILTSSTSSTYQLTDTDGSYAAILQCSSLTTGAPYIQTKSADGSQVYVPFYGSADGSKTFTLSVDMRTYSSINVTYEIKCYDSTGTLITAGIGGTFTGTIACTTTVSRKSISNIYPSGTEYISIKFTLPSTTYTPGTAALSLDAMQIEEGSSFTSYEVSSSVYLSTLDEKIKISSNLDAPGRFSVDGLGNLTSNTLILKSTGDVSLDSNSHAFQIGESSGTNLRIDTNEIQVVNNGNTSTLYLQREGGNLYIGQTGETGSVNMYGDDLTLGSATQLTAPDVYTSTFGTANYVVVGSGGRLRRYVSSSRRYKEDIELVNNPLLDPYRILNIGVYQYRFAPWYLDPEDARSGELVVGLIAEDVEENYPVASNFDEETGLVESWDVKYIVPPMLQIIKDQQEKINNLEERLAILEG